MFWHSHKMAFMGTRSCPFISVTIIPTPCKKKKNSASSAQHLLQIESTKLDFNRVHFLYRKIKKIAIHFHFLQSPLG